jgi:hypothetical protein
VATTAEMNAWIRSISVNPNDPSRKQTLVNTLLDTDEARTVQLKAWFLTYTGRAGTAAEITNWLAQWRSVKDQLVMQQRFLISTPVYQYTQTLTNAGTADERYVEGLMRLMIDPSSRMTAAEKQNAVLQLNRLGRQAYVASLQKQQAYLDSQQEAFTEILSNGNSQFLNLLAGGPKFTSAVDMWKWLLARRKV